MDQQPPTSPDASGASGSTPPPAPQPMAPEAAAPQAMVPPAMEAQVEPLPVAAPPPLPPSAWTVPPMPPAPPAAPVGWAAAPMPSSRGGITGLAKLGALVLVLGGLFWTLIGALLLLAGGLARTILEGVDVEGLGDVRFADIAGGLIFAFGIVILVVAILELLTGIFAWRGSGVARILGILYGLGFGSITLMTALSPSARDAVSGSGATIVPLAIGVAYLYTALVFIARWRNPA